MKIKFLRILEDVLKYVSVKVLVRCVGQPLKTRTGVMGVREPSTCSTSYQSHHTSQTERTNTSIISTTLPSLGTILTAEKRYILE